MVECDRWALRNMQEDFAPIADTAVAFGFLAFFVLVRPSTPWLLLRALAAVLLFQGFNVYLALRMIGNFKLWVSGAHNMFDVLEMELPKVHFLAIVDRTPCRRIENTVGW